MQRGAGDELGAVADRAAADAEDEIDLLGANQLDCAIERGQRRVGFDAGEFDHPVPGERGADLFIDAVALDRAAAVEKQDLGRSRDQVVQAGEAGRAEVDLGRVVIAELEGV